MQHLGELENNGAMCWRAEDEAWIADPERVVKALVNDGFAEYRREVARGGRERATSGGMWQGLDPRTGAVATVIWVAHAPPSQAHVFIDIDGRPIEGSAWAEIDAAVLNTLIAGGGRMTIAQIAGRVGMSEGAVQSIVSMLAGQGKVRIAVVELPAQRRNLAPLAPRRPETDSLAS
jgi:Winged helix-turn-helix DNA-binding